MNALLLAAGCGTRLRPITLSVPKCLVSVGGKPLLEHWIRSIESAKEFSRVLINTHYLAPDVDFFIKKLTTTLSISCHFERNLLGTAGTLFEHREALCGDDFLVAHADNYSLINWQAFIETFRHRPAGIIGTMMLFDTDTPHTCGIVEVDDRGILKKMNEKVANPNGTLANAAVYLFSKNFFDSLSLPLPIEGLDISRDIIPMLYGRLNVFFNNQYHRDIGTIESLEKTNDYIFQSKFNRISGALS